MAGEALGAAIQVGSVLEVGEHIAKPPLSAWSGLDAVSIASSSPYALCACTAHCWPNAMCVKNRGMFTLRCICLSVKGPSQTPPKFVSNNTPFQYQLQLHETFIGAWR